ncbi:MAG: class I SAM-dependent rRNA methyltransferase [Clostridia bacterium]|nr:class I SAM-dependent rRNA methyltransferase [Clostridia bacterium]
MGYEVILKRGEEKRILAGHPWVYANEVQRIDGRDRNGSLAIVKAQDGRYIGKGYINHLSKILVRIFIRDDSIDTEEYYLNALTEAKNLRESLGYKNNYRLVFAEADNLPGLVIDKYADYFVIQCMSLGIDQRKQMIVDCLVKLFNPKGIYERSDAQVRTKEGLQPFSGLLSGEVPDEIIIKENGIKMSVDVKNGQKTGYFLDQKENRYAIRRYAKDKSVLDCFCNSGGFSMNAALTAKSVKAVDISETALNTVKRNIELNGYKNVETLEGDVFKILRDEKQTGTKYGMVILDPPAFCKSVNEVKDALKGYKDINILGMKLVEKGGFLVSSSCSHFVTMQMFMQMLTDASRESGKRIRVLEIKTQAPDHPSLLADEETSYLKFVIMQVL